MRDGVVDEICSTFWRTIPRSLARMVIKTGSLEQKEEVEGQVNVALDLCKDDELRKVWELVRCEVVEAAQKS